MVGVAASGEAFGVVGDCEMWSCPSCRVVKISRAMAGPRRHLADGGALFVAELPVALDDKGDDKILKVVSARASNLRRSGAHGEYAGVRRLQGRLLFATANLGGPRAFPLPEHFRLVTDEAEFEDLVERWFAQDGLRTTFATPGSSDLHTFASAAWSQVKQSKVTSGATMVAGIDSEAALDRTLARFRRLAGEHCTRRPCVCLPGRHCLAIDQAVRLLLRAAEMSDPDDVWAFEGAHVEFVTDVARRVLAGA